jgi:hypothetical protein
MERFAKAKFDAATRLRRSPAGLMSFLLRYPEIVYLGDNFLQALEPSGACRNNWRLCAATP